MAEPVTRVVDAVRADASLRDELLPLLSDAHPVYRDRGAADVVRLRGYAMQCFERAGLPDAALPFVLEDLESSQHAYAVAAAARALRGWAEPRQSAVALLRRALENVASRDDYVSFASLDAVGSPEEGMTATEELERTLVWLSERIGARPAPLRDVDVDTERRPWASCCGLPESQRGVRHISASDRTEPRELGAIELQDQDGVARSYAEAFVGRPTIVVFFYTRCDNPAKCSLSIAKLARVQRLLESRGLSREIGLAAITYDPEYDDSERLRAYGLARGFVPGDAHRLLRAGRDQAALRAFFELGVNYVHSVVNRHRVELYVLDAQGRPAVLHRHLEWDERAVVDDAASLLRPATEDGARTVVRGVVSSMPSLALALVPKCPACWAAYLSAFGIAGVGQLAPWLVAALAALVVVNLAASWIRARRTQRFWPFALAAAGAVALIPLGLVLALPGALLSGAVLTLAGSLTGALGLPYHTLAGPWPSALDRRPQT